VRALACLLVAAAVTSETGCSPRSPQAQEPIRLRIGGVGANGDERALRLKVLAEVLTVEPLIAIGWDGRPNARLADTWQWEDERRSLRLHLQPGVAFHNGHPVNAKVVAATLRTVQTAGGFDYLESIETPDDSTVILRLSRFDQFLLSQLSEINIVDLDDPDGGAGPFKVVRRTPTVLVEKNSRYYRGEPGIHEIEVLPYETQRSAWAAMMRGDVDMLHSVARESVEFMEGVSDVRTYASIRPSYMLMMFNLRHPVLQHVEVRRALTQAINREQIVRKEMRDHGRVADDPVWPFHWAYSRAASRYSYNADAARVRLEAAGLRIAPASKPDLMPSRLRFRCLMASDEPQFERIALLLQRDLSEVGVDMVLEPVPQGELTRRSRAGDFDAYLFQTNTGRSLDRLYGFWHSPAGKAATMQNSGYTGADALLDQLRAAQSEAEIRSAVADLQQRLHEDAPAVFLTWLETIRALDRRFTMGERDDPDVFANVWKWRPAVRAAQ
jgi:peptide/nickel transport system substrate-binding protein